MNFEILRKSNHAVGGNFPRDSYTTYDVQMPPERTVVPFRGESVMMGTHKALAIAKFVLGISFAGDCSRF